MNIFYFFCICDYAKVGIIETGDSKTRLEAVKSSIFVVENDLEYIIFYYNTAKANNGSLSYVDSTAFLASQKYFLSQNFRIY
mgnify:CR=1 FL=1